MARPEEQMRRNQWPALENTTLCEPRRHQVVEIQPRVQQSYFTGENQYQHRMMAARRCLGGGGKALDPVVRGSPRGPPCESPRPIRVGPNSNFRHAALGPLATSGKFELMNEGDTSPSANVFFRRPGPIPIPQGPMRGMMQKSTGPEFQRAADPWGNSLRHGRKDRVAFFQNPLQ
jgi:hypothetical protein